MPADHIVPAASQPRPESNAIAPLWHTAVLLLFLAAFGLLTLHMRAVDPAAQANHRVQGYLLTMAFEWLMVAFIAWGARFGGASLRSLAGAFAMTWRSVLRDLGIALAFLLVAQIVLGATTGVVGHFIHSDVNNVLKNLLPHTGLEAAVYLFLALTAGICEEMIFRGYMQRQFTVWTGNAAVGIGLQGTCFGIAHSYQGPGMVIVIAVYGFLFGALAWWRKSLRPSMAAHFLQDAIGGLALVKFLPK
ncbi:MAG: type II CAAX endopeptidase family protein [Terracidiphilus sp.]|jgi:membrane protease YdiL (CAAX protease family)